MKTLRLALTLMLVSSMAWGQDEKKNAAYIEAGGTAFFYSLNYDRLIAKTTVFHVNARVGLSSLFKDEPYIIPLELTGSIGRETHYFEFGPGYSLTKGRDDGLGSLRLGYRKEKPKTILRIALVFFPAIASGDTNGMLPWAGISYGFRF